PELRLDVMIAGAADVNLHEPGAIYGTKISGTRSLRWRSDHYGQPAQHLGEPQLLCLSAGTDLVATGVVRFAEGFREVDGANLPADDRWRLFGLVRGNVYSSTSDDREVFVLRRDRTASCGGRVPEDPIEGVRHGELLEAWYAALEHGWDEEELRCLVFMVYTQMETLLTEAQPAVAAELLEESYWFIADDLDQLRRREYLDEFRQHLLERIPLP